MTQDHVDVLGRALWAGQTFTLAETLLLANIETLVRGLADGSLRCADSKTQRIVELDDLEVVVEAAKQVMLEAEPGSGSAWEVWDALHRWLSTPEQPAPSVSPVSSGEAKE